MSEASDAGRWDLMFYALAAMVIMILAVDQLLWRPIVAWAVKFRVEEGGDQSVPTSWFLDWLRRSRLLALAGGLMALMAPAPKLKEALGAQEKHDPTITSPWINRAVLFVFSLLVLSLVVAAWKLLALLVAVSWEDWEEIGIGASATLGRVLTATVLGTVWSLPAGLAIGLSPRLSRFFQPIIQIVASFPAPMLFPLVLFVVLNLMGIGLGWGSILLLLMGTQWYILFNVIAGASAIPADLKELATLS
jgi:NitT/TauT family transport system permease protein